MKLLPIILLAFVAIVAANIYGDIPVDDYLLGRFDAESIVKGIQTFKPIYLRNEVLSSLLRMYESFTKENPTISFPIISATRNYTYQTGIWNNKWNNLYANISCPLERGMKILQYSAMPGTSRHHWGTDLDLYSLENEDFLAGNGSIIYRWLQNNAVKFGFCQPYTAGRTVGYNEEKWHWSYFPLSSRFTNDWINNFFHRMDYFVSKIDFMGAPSCGVVAPVFVININSNCLL